MEDELSKEDGMVDVLYATSQQKWILGNPSLSDIDRGRRFST